MSSSSSPQNPNPDPNEGRIIVSRRRILIRVRKRHCLRLRPSRSETLTLTPTPTPWTPLGSESDTSRCSKLHLELESSLEKVRSSKFYLQFLSQLHSPRIQSLLSSFPQFDLVVYGIGSIESFEGPRLQLSLALLLRRELGARIRSVEAFDPVLSATECSVMEDLGFPVMRFNELCRRKVKVPTLFYMPHCSLYRYQDLVGANWGEGLGMTVILGNSFCAYVEDGMGMEPPVVEDVGMTLNAMRWRVREVEMEGLRSMREKYEYEFFEAFSYMNWHFFELDDDNCKVNWGERRRGLAKSENIFGDYRRYVGAGDGIVPPMFEDVGPWVFVTRQFVWEVDTEGVGRWKEEEVGIWKEDESVVGVFRALAL